MDDGGADDRCAACREAGGPPEALEPSMIVAGEAEVLNALGESWRFVGSAKTTAYLGRTLTRVARHVEGAPDTGAVAVVQEPALWSIAFASGNVILSTGMLGALEDEAELAFVLGHELAHAACPATGVELVRVGLRNLVRAEGKEDRGAWVATAIDLIRLGHGDRREQEADAVALEALVDAGYDPASAEALLARLGTRIDQGDEDLADLALAHPPPVDRLRRLQTLRNLHWAGGGTARTDREVFRRAAGENALHCELEPVRPFDGLAAPKGTAERPSRARWVWTAVVVALLATLLVLWGVL